MLLRQVLLVALFAWLSPLGAFCAADEKATSSEHQQLLKQFAEKWTKSKQLFSQLAGTATVVEPAKTSELRFLWDQDCFLLERTILEVSKKEDAPLLVGRGTVRAYNQTQAFFLGRASQDTPWELAKVVNKNKIPAAGLQQQFTGELAPYLFAPLCIGLCPIEQFLSREETKLQDIIPAPNGDYLIRFTCSDPENKSGYRQLQSGHLTLSKTNDWLIATQEVVCHDSIVQTQRYTIDYHAATKENSIRPFVVTRTISSPLESAKSSFAISDLKSRPLKAAEISLTAYGLPEVAGDLKPESKPK